MIKIFCTINKNQIRQHFSLHFSPAHKPTLYIRLQIMVKHPYFLSHLLVPDTRTWTRLIHISNCCMDFILFVSYTSRAWSRLFYRTQGRAGRRGKSLPRQRPLQRPAWRCRDRKKQNDNKTVDEKFNPGWRHVEQMTELWLVKEHFCTW